MSYRVSSSPAPPSPPPHLPTALTGSSSKPVRGGGGGGGASQALSEPEQPLFTITKSSTLSCPSTSTTNDSHD